MSVPAEPAGPGRPADHPSVAPTSAGPTGAVPTSAASVGPELPSWPIRSWSRRARLAGYLGVAAVAVAGSTMIYLVDPAQPGHYPPCPFKWATRGLDCPGCGSMRGLHQLLHGHIGAAANYNILLVVAAPCLVVGWFVAVLRLLGVGVRTPRMPSLLNRAIPIAVIAFWIIRNTPGPVGHWLHS
ncbi:MULTISPECIES: DUF2752 domain-containing protein [unclassified Frankia]|uniref:DUF2752 domain-containing protein n=1 Tax=unclassified Frankia TaxID=2632575 RepID=UPI0027DE32C5|nr:MULTISPECIES: DUF2752 domain-containing protein [unclassified Frankia]